MGFMVSVGRWGSLPLWTEPSGERAILPADDMEMLESDWSSSEVSSSDWGGLLLTGAD